MSSARGRASRRDDNEPEIRKRFKEHGWHTETLSAPGMPDLLAYPPRPSLLGFTQVKHVDVKGAKGKPTPAQVEKWTALSEKGIPVYVCRTREDVDALVAGMFEAWEPEVSTTGVIRAPQPHGRRLSIGAAYIRKLAEAEEALIPERARAELKRRGAQRTPREMDYDE